MSAIDRASELLRDSSFHHQCLLSIVQIARKDDLYDEGLSVLALGVPPEMGEAVVEELNRILEPLTAERIHWYCLAFPDSHKLVWNPSA